MRTLRRSWVSLLALTLAWFGTGCIELESGHATAPDIGRTSTGGVGSTASIVGSNGSVVGTRSSGTQAASTGNLLDPTPIDGAGQCTLPDTEVPVFAEQTFAKGQLTSEQRVLYTWTTEEQIEELRAGTPLLSRTERAGLGPGAAYEYFAELAETNAIAAVLNQAEFAPSRHAWLHPWATRMGWPGENYGNQLIRIVVRPEAWVVHVVEGKFTVWDLSGNLIEAEQVLEAPERIGVVYFRKDVSLGGASCGSFRANGQGFREYIVNNPAMIESWSHRTEKILERLQSDIALVEEFAQRIRACPDTRVVDQWSVELICRHFESGPDTELGAYEEALALPSQYYLPRPANMVALANTLKADLFVPSALEGEGGGGAGSSDASTQ